MEIGTLHVKNRLARSATCERMCPPDGAIAPLLVEFYRRLARGGSGLIVTGHAFVRADGRAGEGMMGADGDDLLPGLHQLAQAVHEAGAAVVCQLNHAGRQSRPELLGGRQPVAPSVVADRATGIAPRELRAEEIEGLVACFVAAADRCRRAGFDGVQLHCAHGYLMSQFISPHTNRRTDAWGGSLERRARFPLEVLRRIRQTLGRDFPVLVKLNTEDFIEGGLSLEESCRIGRMLEAQGVDAIEVSAGMAETADRIVRTGIDSEEKEAYFLPQVRAFRRHVRVPLICVGGLRSRSVMERVVESGAADLVALCRPLVREPDLPLKLQRGLSTRATCISCNRCTHDPEGRLACALDLEGQGSA